MSISPKDQVREQAENDLGSFIRLVHPQRVLGGIHREVISWWTREEAKSHQLLLLPRDHMKSALAAYRVAQAVTKDPTIRVLYVSSTSNLAVKQLKFIKDILTSDTYRYYWPEHVKKEEAQREKWSETEIMLDHPLRKVEAIRDPTIFAAGLTTNYVGLHFDITVLDDIVVHENAYTEEGRSRVATAYSLLASVESAEARQWVVGTRYFPEDLYNQMAEMTYDTYNAEGDTISQEHLYEVFERQVESNGDGTGEFLWPRQQRYDGRWFGFNEEILSRKRAQYLNKTQFRAQYYNNPHDPDNEAIPRSDFQYFRRDKLYRLDGRWHIGNRRLNVFAAVDFAYRISKKSDFTAIVVVGVDNQQNYYVLDIERFKTDKISEYFNKILKLHQKWDFRKLRAEINAGQSVIVKDLKDNYIRMHGLSLSIEEHTSSRATGSKEERIEAILQPRYANKQIWHYDGGNCQILEEELVSYTPTHDDVKDALAAAIDSAVAPTMMMFNRDKPKYSVHSRFGGVA